MPTGRHFTAGVTRTRRAVCDSIQQPDGDDAGSRESLRRDRLAVRLGLTSREATVLDLARRGLRSSEIARELGIALGTVKLHLSHVYTKLRVSHRGQALSLLKRLDLTVGMDPDHETTWSDWFDARGQIERRRRGEVLFRRAELGDRVYLLDRGRIDFEDIGATAQPGTVIGEIAAFTPERMRTHTARCAADVELRYLTREQIREAYFTRPDFGFQLVRLITRRLLADRERGM